MSGQNHQTLSRCTFWATIDTWWCHLLTSGAHRFHVCWIEMQKIKCFFTVSDSTKLSFVFFVFYLISTHLDPPDVPAPPSKSSRAIKYCGAAAFRFQPSKGRDVESLARLSEQRPGGWYSQCRCTWLNRLGHVSVSHESTWSGAKASAWLSDWVLRRGGRFQQRER